MATVTPNDRSITRRQLLKAGGGVKCCALEIRGGAPW